MLMIRGLNWVVADSCTNTVVDALKGLFEAQGDSNNTPTP